MAILRCTAVLNHKSGRPEDASRNVWHFEDQADNIAYAANVAAALSQFYISLNPILGTQLAVSSGAHRIETATVFEGSPGESDDVVSPLIGTTSFTLAPSGAGAAYPAQVAIALSFRGNYESVSEQNGFERPRSRRRGRVFIGPVMATTGTADANGDIFVNTTTRETIMDAYDAMHDQLDLVEAGVWRHIVYSRANGLGYNVVEISCDDSHDIIRRRKLKRTSKYVRAITPGTPAINRSGTNVVLAT